MDKNPKELLKEYWGYDAFRPVQEEIIASVLNGVDTVALLPTGGGKSICFQIPALMMDGICLVISPLIALMKDQVEHLTVRGIKACFLHSGMKRKEIDAELESSINGKYKFLYISPERLSSESFIVHLKEMKVSLLAVDEAHCISQWGYDFRPEYLTIAKVRNVLTGVRTLALTASATAKVVQDISEKLMITKAVVFRKSFYRPNLSYIVLNESDKNSRLKKVCSRINGTGLVYVRNRKKTAELAKILKLSGMSADFYHAGLSNEERNRKQAAWQSGQIRIMVCTNAFGMGIDKPDVRFVLHFEMPDGLESYYQEAGRAGRDEKESWCILLFNETDAQNAELQMLQHFPSLEYIEQVYQSLGNFLSISINAGKGQDFVFDLNDFCEKFNLKAVSAFAALEVLHKSGLLFLSQGLEKPSRVKILYPHLELYDFQLKNPTLDPFIKTLLRSYGGELFDAWLNVREDELGRRLKLSEADTKKNLMKLHKLQVIDYVPKTDQPYLTFLENRQLKTGIDKRNLEWSKERASERLQSLISFCSATLKCRSVQLLEYFDETEATPCGKCDFCRDLKKRELSNEAFKELVRMIKINLVEQPMSAEMLAARFKTADEKNMFAALRWLLDEGWVTNNTENNLVWRRN